MSFYAEQLARAVKRHPVDYDSYVVKKKGQALPLTEMRFDIASEREKARRAPKKPIVKIMQKKQCLICNKDYFNTHHGVSDWLKRKYCSHACAQEAQRGKSSIMFKNAQRA